MFGVNAAPEIFQHALGEVLRDIPGITHFIDDIIVHGKTKREHDHSLTETLNHRKQQAMLCSHRLMEIASHAP
ncbi:vcbs repeat-containing protein [Plakobranchus ocellatus]|uniref:Vcbs repeat-containing protein n=1 Tax=Plakobranchus ocellatus TaxID=259542 RepID=A0AAV3Y295_9GAST|nr:vcbs repeat-containing protein [Plakobranchus ocellatus]